MNTPIEKPEFLTLHRPEGDVTYEVSGNGPLFVCITGMWDLRTSYCSHTPVAPVSGPPGRGRNGTGRRPRRRNLRRARGVMAFGHGRGGPTGGRVGRRNQTRHGCRGTSGTNRRSRRWCWNPSSLAGWNRWGSRCGLNRYRPLGERYRSLLDLLAGHVASRLATARAYEAERVRGEQLAELDRAKTGFSTNVSQESGPWRGGCVHPGLRRAPRTARRSDHGVAEDHRPNARRPPHRRGSR
jgi:hypothetical protein